MPTQPSMPQQTTLPRPAPGYQPQTMRPEAVDEGPGVPHYPYPPYPNPFYEASPQRKPLADGVEWLWGVSSNVAERFSSFIDTTLFPRKAATYGGTRATPQQVSPPAQPQSQSQSLPQPFMPKPPGLNLLPGGR